MNYSDLDIQELLSFQDGLIHFAGERSLLFSANAMGILRKELHYILGEHTTRGVFIRLGFAHGWRTAERMKDDFPWDSPEQWRKAGGRLHALQGHVRVEIPNWSSIVTPRSPDISEEPFAHSLWKDSYEADQHLRHMGQAEEPVCWTLTGFVSGYLSFCNGRRVIALEQRCRGKGDSVCFMEARFEEEWGDEIQSILPLLETPCLVHGLRNATEALLKVEQGLAKKRALRRQEELAHGGRIVSRAYALTVIYSLLVIASSRGWVRLSPLPTKFSNIWGR